MGGETHPAASSPSSQERVYGSLEQAQEVSVNTNPIIPLCTVTSPQYLHTHDAAENSIKLVIPTHECDNYLPFTETVQYA